VPSALKSGVVLSGTAPFLLLQNKRIMTTSTTTLLTTPHFHNVTVSTTASVYFDGKCVSHGITLADGTKKSVGVVLPSTLTFNTGAPEIMECTAGSCEYKLAGTDAWVKSVAGEKFSIAGNSSFEIRVTEAYHYVCHFG
jgi:purine/pyrimidine-nucleoside phosphorylase